jgi:hypothetical protein
MTQPAATSTHRRRTAVDPPDDTHPHTDGTGTGLLGFCDSLGDQSLAAGKKAENLHLAVRRVLGAADDWQRLDIRSLDLVSRVVDSLLFPGGSWSRDPELHRYEI